MKHFLMIGVAAVLMGCPSVPGEAPKPSSENESPTQNRSGYFNQDVRLGDDVVSVRNQFGEQVAGSVLSEEGTYTVQYTDGAVETIVIDKTAPWIGFVNSSATYDLYTGEEFEDSLPENAVKGEEGGSGYVGHYDAYWKDGKEPTEAGEYIRVYVVYDRAGNISDPYEWPVTVYNSNGNPAIVIGTLTIDGMPAESGEIIWRNSVSDDISLALDAEVSGGSLPYSYIWKIDGEIVGSEASYVIPADTLTENVYSIVLTVKDAGGQIAAVSGSVGIDMTAPVIQRAPQILIGYDTIEERLNFTETVALLKIIEAHSGIKTVEGSYIGLSEGETIKVKTPYQRRVTVTDYAGNTSQPYEYTVEFWGSAKDEDEMLMTGELGSAVSVQDQPTPTQGQIDWYRMGQYAFIHWGPNAFGAGQIGNGEWGNGYPYGAEAFRPTQSADVITQGWIDDIVSVGMTGLIFVAKHHDGFCLWDTVTTEYSVCKSGEGYSYYDEDILSALVKNMKEYNLNHPGKELKLGVYVSPWDRNHWTYAGVETSESGEIYPYLEYVLRTQITEVIECIEKVGEGYVTMFELWLDGANEPSGWYGGKLYADHVSQDGASVSVTVLENGRADVSSFRQTYDWAGKVHVTNPTLRNVTLPDDWRDRIYTMAQEVVDSYEAAEIMVFGNQIRWVGNEQGWAGRTNWMTGSGTDGSEDSLKVQPAEADMKTQNGWFYTPNEDKGSAQMIEFWYRSVGRNATLLLNFSPDTAGEIPSYNLNSAGIMWQTVSSDLSDNLAARAYRVQASNIRDNTVEYSPYRLIDGDDSTYWSVDDGRSENVGDEWVQLSFVEAVSFNRIVLQENIELGQRVKSFTVEYKNGENDSWKTVTYPNMPTTITGDTNDPDTTTTIGFKRILRTDKIQATDVRITFTDYRKGVRVPVTLSEFGLYYAQ